ncbi:MAG: hypothetical protein ACFE7R_09025, partial [Candidatus Hodarchaeota archaeon]
IDGDEAAEVAAALQNKRVILWNHDQVALFSRTMDEPVSDVWLEDITHDSELEVVIAGRRGTVVILSAAGYELKRLQLGTTITVFGVLSFGERKLFVTGNHSPLLKVWDIDGIELSQISLSESPKALATGVPDDVSDTAYLVVSTRNRRVAFWEITDSTEVSNAERVTLQEIESTKTVLYRRAIKCGNCGAPTSPEAIECASCGATLEMLEEYAIEEYMRESIDSITSKHSRIQLKELDRILRKTLPRPAAYNLRRSIQAMIKKGQIEGHFDGNVFVRTTKPKARRELRTSKSSLEKTSKFLTTHLKVNSEFDVLTVERETGVPRSILRRTLMILLGESLVEGILEGDIFTLAENQDINKFIKILYRELEA